MSEFKIGDRVFFIEKHGLGVFGNVEKMDHDGQRLLVRTDDMQLYEIFGDKVTVLTRRE